ncbi:MAG: larB [Chloroflexi bacterium]|nr:larB [Chloroflexota bacterium]
MRDPLQELRGALDAAADNAQPPHLVHLDLNRESRTGVPEIVFTRGKDVASLLAIAQAMLDERGRVILSTAGPAKTRAVREAFPEYRIDEFPRARMVVVKRPDYAAARTGGRVGIVTAGTADAPAAEEAAVIAEEMGCDTQVVYDVGVAGLHRLIAPLTRFVSEDVDAIVVAAGMDGALPSVVSGLVDIPIVGLPTSTGYGVGGRGLAALLSMLQTCAPGLTVVNVDNGVGAGAAAARIANRMAAARAAVGAQRHQSGSA